VEREAGTLTRRVYSAVHSPLDQDGVAALRAVRVMAGSVADNLKVGFPCLALHR
jgi:hypothetical protein